MAIVNRDKRRRHSGAGRSGGSRGGSMRGLGDLAVATTCCNDCALGDLASVVSKPLPWYGYAMGLLGAVGALALLVSIDKKKVRRLRYVPYRERGARRTQELPVETMSEVVYGKDAA